MTWQPTVPAARMGRKQARNRRFFSKASTEQNAGMATSYDPGAADLAVTLGAPTEAGQFVTLAINTTGGGNLVITSTANVRNGGSDFTQITLAGAGANVVLQSYYTANALQWLLVVLNGGTTP